MRHTFLIAALLCARLAHAGMITDPVTSNLQTSFDGSWSNGGSAVVGPGIEFNKNPNGTALLTLDIADTSFTLHYINTATSGNFNDGILGFDFTDLNQTFAGISLVPGNTFPVGTFTGSTLTPHTIQLIMNGPIIANGASYTATWNVTFAGQNPTPEPGTFMLLGTGLAGMAFFLRSQRRMFQVMPRRILVRLRDRQ